MATPQLPPAPIQTQTQGGPHQIHPQAGQVQYVILNTGQRNVTPRPAVKAEYSEKNIESVRWLTRAQLLLGVTIFILHVVTTAINDHFLNKLADVRKHFRDFFMWHGIVDNAATGVWFGLLVIISAIIGIGGYRRQKKGLIVAHLVLNTLILLCVLAPVITLALTIGSLNSCRRWGESYSSVYHHDHVHYPISSARSTTTVAPFEFFSETIEGSSGNFYCKSALFKAWLALDCIILVSTIVLLFLTLTLLIYNCIATCRCCQRTGCCCKPCCCYGSSDSEIPPPIVSYYSQPAAAPLNRPQFTTHPQFVSQPQFTPELYAPQVPMYAQPMMMPAMAACGQPTASGVNRTQLLATSANSTPAGAAAPDEKWEDLPPEYAAIFQNQGNQ